MFGWFKRRKTVSTSETTAGSAAPPSSPRAVAATEAIAPVVTRGPGPAPRVRPGPRPLAPPIDYRDPPPKVGMAAVEFSAKSQRKALVTRVHRDGQRLVARLEETGAGRNYALHPDGTYRLTGGGSPSNAPRLVLDLK